MAICFTARTQVILNVLCTSVRQQPKHTGVLYILNFRSLLVINLFYVSSLFVFFFTVKSSCP